MPPTTSATTRPASGVHQGTAQFGVLVIVRPGQTVQCGRLMNVDMRLNIRLWRMAKRVTGARRLVELLPAPVAARRARAGAAATCANHPSLPLRVGFQPERGCIVLRCVRPRREKALPGHHLAQGPHAQHRAPIASFRQPVGVERERKEQPQFGVAPASPPIKQRGARATSTRTGAPGRHRAIGRSLIVGVANGRRLRRCCDRPRTASRRTATPPAATHPVLSRRESARPGGLEQRCVVDAGAAATQAEVGCARAALTPQPGEQARRRSAAPTPGL